MDVMRKDFTPLTEENKKLVSDVKVVFNDIHKYLLSCPQGRCMSLALTNLEQASMWAVKEITAQEHNDV